MEKKQTFFQKEWLDDPEFKDWIQPVDSCNTEAKCKLCSKVFTLSNMGVGALKSHMKYKKHKDAVSNRLSHRNFFGQPAAVQPKHVPKVTSQSLDNFIVKEHVFKAELIWALKKITSNFSLSSCEGISNCFKVMFPDSKIANEFQLGKTKCAYILHHGVAPFFEKLLLDEIKLSNFYSVSFDESMNKVTQNEQMDIVITYWNNENNNVEVRYLTSIFLGHTKAADLLVGFEKATDVLNLTNMLHVSMDGPNVNWKFHDLLVAAREESGLPGILNVGSCGLHVVHGAFKTGAKATDWDLGKVLKALFVILHDTPARRSDYFDVTGSHVFPQMFCGTRWIEDGPVAERAIEIWDNIMKLYVFWEKLPKSKQPSSKSFTIVQKASKDQMTVAKFHFFLYVSSILKPFLTAYQTLAPMVRFMYDDLYKLTKEIMSLFIKPSVLTSGIKLAKIDLRKKENLVHLKKVNFGFGANKFIQEKLRSDEITLQEINHFKENCIMFSTSLVQKLFERSPLVYSVSRNASSLSPQNMVFKTDLSVQWFKNLLSKLLQLNRLSAKQCDDTHAEYRLFLSKVLKTHRQEFELFDKDVTRLDNFFFNEVGMKG